MKRMLKKSISILLSLLTAFSVCGMMTLEAAAEEILTTDHIDFEILPTPTEDYEDFTDFALSSDARYAGQNSAKDGAMVFSSSGTGRGLVSTESGGRLVKVSVIWSSKSALDGTLQIYGKNTPYTGSEDLYLVGEEESQGKLLGTFVYEGDFRTVQTIEIKGDYAYIGLRPKSGDVYLKFIEITWAKQGDPSVSQPPAEDPGACALCGKIHDTNTVYGFLVAKLHNLIYMAKQLVTSFVYELRAS
ncbi:MAG: hypothetical protein IK080_03905 [Clostridia bacterium]|nr:hypothetical protein [Clostridia bacterium]